jgi:hypothetical protein
VKVLQELYVPIYCENDLVNRYKVYLVDKLPSEKEYIEVGGKKGYVVSIQEDEETNSYIAYLEKHLGDWYNQIQEVCEVVYLKESE